MSKKVYAVEVRIETVAMVLAENEFEAIQRAERDYRDIVSDAMPGGLDIDVIGPIAAQSELPKHGWDETCVPYGGDRLVRLSALLPA